MQRLVCRSLFLLALIAILSSTNLNAQKDNDASSSDMREMQAAPVPAQILNAKRVFIANGGMAVWGAPRFKPFHGGPSRAYDEFYAAMKNWGHYALVAAPTDADLIFEISFQATGSAGDYPSLRLGIVDPKTHVLLWAINQSVEYAGLQRNRDNNFDHAMLTLVSDVKNLNAQAKTSAESAQK